MCVDANTTAITTGLRASVCVCENKTKMYTILKKKKKAHNWTNNNKWGRESLSRRPRQ